MVRPARTRLWPLIAVSIRVASLGLATVGLLKTLCGSWTSIVLLRRRVLSVMTLLFAAADSGDPCDIIRLSPELKSELWCLLGFPRTFDRCRFASRACELYFGHGRLDLGRCGCEVSGARGYRARIVPPLPLQRYLDSPFTCRARLAREHDLLAVDEELPDDFQFAPKSRVL